MVSSLCNPALPIFEKKDEIIAALRGSQVIIVSGETGSGKTTQLPLICLEAGLCGTARIGSTQPRRIAATSVAAYVAQQVKSPLGSLVGYKVRFSDRESAGTKIKFMTDGILLAELQHDRLLSAYDVIIIDEVHERSLNIDFLLGYLRGLLTKRPRLKCILSSATMETGLFREAFTNAPVLHVSGRMYPVTVQYRAVSREESDDGGGDYVALAADAVEDLLTGSSDGDILVFMPTEKDILETKEILDKRISGFAAVMPLYGRLGLAQQMAIFSESGRRKVVVATNIAETSLTVPNIRYVVDTGLARVKRYDPSRRITRLAVEPVSQASTAQRAGRCGRVRDGVCIRLFPEDDLLARPQFTDPEILRANLSQVILTMASLGLGPVETFPFLEPPSHQAITQGYSSLVELGALDRDRRLTDRGKAMAALPLDPPLSRMIVEAAGQHCLREVGIIASALCAADVRLRPFDKKEEADAAHRRFADPLSDFLFPLRLWEQAAFEKRSRTSLRRFCKDHFLSYVRMREWFDVHGQIERIIGTGGRTQAPPASYDQIHRCIASGLAPQIAKKTEDGSYRIAKGRLGWLFPGSSLVQKKPDWIVCLELVETSRLYCRTCASIDPLWLESLAPHLCKYNYSEPAFDPESGGVRAKERVVLFGLGIVENRTVDYARINRREASDIFIRDGLVEGQLLTHHGFFRHNRQLLQHLETIEKKLRLHGLCADEGTILSFYQLRLASAASVHDLGALIKRHGGDGFLYMKESDFVGDDLLRQASLFPDFVTIGCQEYPVRYEFDPLSQRDGAIVDIPSADLPFLNEAVFDWLIPGLYEPRIRFFLEGLAKLERKQLEPIAVNAGKIASSLVYRGIDFISSVCESISLHLGARLAPASVPTHDLPQHLMVKIALKKGSSATPPHMPHVRPAGQSGHHDQVKTRSAWENNVRKWERKNLHSWDFGDIPDSVTVICSNAGFPVYGFVCLKAQEHAVDLVVLALKEEQLGEHPEGVKMLVELCLSKELAWLEKELKFDKNLEMLCSPFGKTSVFRDNLIALIKNHCFGTEQFLIWKKPDFESLVLRIKKKLPSDARSLLPLVQGIFVEYIRIQSMLKKKITAHQSASYIEASLQLKKELSRYMHYLVVNALNYDMLTNYPRYLAAFGIRVERAFTDISRYLSKYDSIKVYGEKSHKLLSGLRSYFQEQQALIIDFVLMVEEYKISLFAQQEVKARVTVSQKRIDEKIQNLISGGIS
jgi:ATP-dependent helicase HrpA